jgi:hypothetical protein
MTTTAVIANGFGVLSTLCFIASFQVKSNKGLYLIQSVANVFYGIQFYLLGATGGLFNMGMQIVRNLLLCKKEEWKWLQHPAMAPLLCVPSLIYMIVTWNSLLDLLPFLAMTVGTFGYWTDSAKKLRIAELFGVSPAWMTYDLIEGAYGGVMNELVILASIVFSIIRFGWKGLDDPSFTGKESQIKAGGELCLE